MADNVSITAGSGTSIATDDCGAGGHAQVVKLAISTDGSATLVPAEATNGLDVDVTRVQGTVTIAGAVTNAGTFVVQENGAGLTALQLIDDIVYTDDTSTHATGTSKGALIMGAAAPTDTAVNANDIGAVGMTVNRGLYVSVQDALPAGTNAIGKLAANSGVDIGDVDVTSVSGTVTVAGTAASDAAVSGNPVLDGGRASAATPTAMSADGDAVPLWLDRRGSLHVVPGHAGTATLSNVNDAATSTSILASNTSRMGVILYNDSPQDLMLKYGATASATSFTYRIPAYGHWEMPSPVYTGALDGIWAADASGAARITELT